MRRTGKNRSFRNALHSLIPGLLAVMLGLGLSAQAHYSDAAPDGNALNSKKVMLLGDSIGAGLGVSQDQSWANGLADFFSACDIEFINASVSGETSAGGLRRLPGLLERNQPDLLLIELGGNDGLRGYPLPRLKENVRAMVDLANEQGATSYILGMRIPPNYGPRYSNGFHDLYAVVAEETGSQLLPFLLEGIGDQRELMQTDGIHPSSEAQPLILRNVVEKLPIEYQCAGSEEELTSVMPIQRQPQNIVNN